MKIRVSVPASAGNTGSAFDSLGIAYGLTNEVIPGMSGIQKALYNANTKLDRDKDGIACEK